MSLVRCPECTKNVSHHANACPFCGYPAPGSGSPQEKEVMESANPESQMEVLKKASLFKRWGDLGQALKDDAGQLKETYGESDLKKRVDEAVAHSKDYLDDKGITEKASQAYDATQEHFDRVSGAKILRLVEERGELQAKYNDILATKLQEALQRIEALEKVIGSKDT